MEQLLSDASAAELMLVERAREKRVPISGSFELLPLCNMNCDMCYVRLSREEMERQGRMRTADEWIALAQQMKKAGTLFLLLTGGEPLIYPEFKRLYLALRDMGMMVTINSNGTMVDEEWADFFGKHPPRRINITLYGADEQAYAELCHYPGGFERTMRGIQLLRSRGVSVRLAGSLTRQNAQDMGRLMDIAQKLGAPMHIDTYMVPATRERSLPYDQQARVEPELAAQARVYTHMREVGLQRFDAFARNSLHIAQNIQPEEGPLRMRCMAGECSFTINWQGEMRPCVVMTEPSAKVFEVGFDAAWKHMMAEREKLIASSKCNGCSLRVLCQTCPACALAEMGDQEAVPEYMCRYTHETMRQLVGYLRSRAQKEQEKSPT